VGWLNPGSSAATALQHCLKKQDHEVPELLMPQGLPLRLLQSAGLLSVQRWTKLVS